jgi:hypothetical protein
MHAIQFLPYDNGGVKSSTLNLRKGFFINATFSDRGTGAACSRIVSLENIFAHNPRFFSHLTTSTDLLNSAHVKIPYTDLPQYLQEMFETTYKKSSHCGQDFFCELKTNLFYVCVLFFTTK